MIIARAPLRLCLGGGGTDLPSYFQNAGSGLVYFASLDWGVTVIRTAPIVRNHYTVQTDKGTEHAFTAQAIEHPIVRAVLLRHHYIKPCRFVIVSDAPVSSGLGASGAITVALLGSVLPSDYQHYGIGYEASAIEMEDLGKTVGYQDPFAAVAGGFGRMTLACGNYYRTPTITVDRIGTDEWSNCLSAHSLLIRCTDGNPRSAGDVLVEQSEKSAACDPQTLARLRASIDYGKKFMYALKRGDINVMASTMRQYWARKKLLSSGVAPAHVIELTDTLDDIGCPGYKLVGAGGSGFVWALFLSQKARDMASTQLSVCGFPSRFVTIGRRGGLTVEGRDLPSLL